MNRVLACVLSFFASVAATTALADTSWISPETLQFRGVVDAADSSWQAPWRVAHFRVNVLKGVNACQANGVRLVPWSQVSDDGVLRIGVRREQLEASPCIELYMPVYETVEIAAPYPVGGVRQLELDNGDGTTTPMGMPNEILWRVGIPGDGSK